jgi:hypothetical protein
MINSDQIATGLLVIMVNRGGGLDVSEQIETDTKIGMHTHRRKTL